VTTLAGAYGQVGCSDGVGAKATFARPGGVAFAGGTLYVSDSRNHVIRRVDVQTAAVSTLAGACGQAGGVDGAASDARFRNPGGLAIDAAGQNLYVADTDNETIRAFSLATGEVSTVAGATGTAGATDGVGAAALFFKPTGLAIDGAGTLYVADVRNQSVRQVVPGAGPGSGVVSTVATVAAPPGGVAIDQGSLLVSLGDHRLLRVGLAGARTTLAGAAGARGFVDGVGVAARFDGPAGLFDDGAGSLYVADEVNAAIRRVALANAGVSTVAGQSSVGSTDGAGGQALFSAPGGLAADATFVYVADTGNDVVRRIRRATAEVTTLAGAAGHAGLADGAPGSSRFDHPQGIALDGPAQKLYVVDAGNRSIRSIDLARASVSTLALAAAPGDAFAGLSQPAGIALVERQLFVTDYAAQIVVSIDLDRARVSTFAGQAGATGSADGTGAAATFYGPAGIAWDGAGHLYVADELNNCVRRIAIATGAVSTLAGEPAVPGGNDGAGANAHFDSPTSIAADAGGDVFVSDLLNNRVRHVDAATGRVTTVVGGAIPGVALGALPAQLGQPGPIALTPEGGLLVVSENSVLLAH
jgi:DNA-binding beta-propeller fold protein YncE